MCNSFLSLVIKFNIEPLFELFSTMSFPEIKRFVSSAKKIVDRSLVQLARSLMYIRKKLRPKNQSLWHPTCDWHNCRPHLVIFNVCEIIL